MKILIITTEIYSNKSATGNIVKQYLDYAHNNKLDIQFTLVGLSPNLLNTSTEIIAPEAKYCFVPKYTRQTMKNILKNNKIGLINKLSSLFFTIKIAFENRTMGCSPTAANHLFKRARKETRKNQFDLIISFAGLIEPLLAIKKMQHFSHTPSVIYNTDPFSTRTNISKKIHKKIYDTESFLIKEAKIIIVPTNHLDLYKKMFPEHSYKIISLSFPSMIPREKIKMAFSKINLPSKNSSKIRFGYFGGIYGGRSLESINEISKISDLFEFSLFSDNVFDFKLNSNIIINKRIPFDEMIQSMITFDFLIILDNNDNQFIPSKIYTYLSTTLPIIIIGKNKELSITYKILRDYPPLFYLEEKSTYYDDLLLFIEKYRNLDKKFDETIYNTYSDNEPEVVAKKFYKILGELITD